MERRSDHANAAGRNLVLFWPPHDIFSALLAQRAFSEETSDVSSQLGGIAIYNRDSMGWYLVVCWTETGETRCIRWEWDSTLNSQHSTLVVVDDTSNFQFHSTRFFTFCAAVPPIQLRLRVSESESRETEGREARRPTATATLRFSGAAKDRPRRTDRRETTGDERRDFTRKL